jgi:hypothetical protein
VGAVGECVRGNALVRVGARACNQAVELVSSLWAILKSDLSFTLHGQEKADTTLYYK